MNWHVLTVVSGLLSTVVNKMYWVVIGNWLWNLYRYGPMLTSSGFWAGLADEDVCARLSSGSMTSDWLIPGRNVVTYGCTALIERSFASFAVIVHTMLYIVFLCILFKAYSSYCQRTRFAKSVTKSILSELKDSGLLLIPTNPLENAKGGMDKGFR
jgi:hypothetical protein